MAFFNTADANIPELNGITWFSRIEGPFPESIGLCPRIDFGDTFLFGKRLPATNSKIYQVPTFVSGGWVWWWRRRWQRCKVGYKYLGGWKAGESNNSKWLGLTWPHYLQPIRPIQWPFPRWLSWLTAALTHNISASTTLFLRRRRNLLWAFFLVASTPWSQQLFHQNLLLQFFPAWPLVWFWTHHEAKSFNVWSSQS